ncbi:MAG: lysophospholipid acyltransferase family protein [Vicinamibacterales bacterium]
MTDTPAWRESRLKRLQVAAIAAVLYPAFALLGLTLRWRVEGREHLEALTRDRRPYILSLWHGRILSLMLFFRRRGIVVITSENFDGEWIARIITRFGYGTARGSSSRKARAATLQLVREIRAGHPAAFTLDGPRGPARVAKPGAAWLAGATGAPLLPAHAEAERSWALRSWDRTQIPKPFSRVAVVIGAPLPVPRLARGAGADGERVALEASLEELRTRARALACGGR